MKYSYEKDGSKIYENSFSIIRQEANLSKFDSDEEKVVVRMIHAIGLVGLEDSISFTPNFVKIARKALEEGANILCDTKMVSEGITRSRLPKDNKVICTLGNKEVASLAKEIGNTRTAAAIHFWEEYINKSVVVFGNAPTALFYFLETLSKRSDLCPIAVIGCPVGFVGAAESKEALWNRREINSLVVKGRLGGSAVAVAAINAIAQEKE